MQTKPFKISSKYAPAGNQPKAIQQLIEGVNCGDDTQQIGWVKPNKKSQTHCSFFSN